MRGSFVQPSSRLSDVSGMDFRLAAPAFVAVIIWYLPPALSLPSAADVLVKLLCFPPRMNGRGSLSLWLLESIPEKKVCGKCGF